MDPAQDNQNQQNQVPPVLPVDNTPPQPAPAVAPVTNPVVVESNPSVPPINSNDSGFPNIMSESSDVAPPPPVINGQAQEPSFVPTNTGKKFGAGKMIATMFGILLLAGGVLAGTFLVRQNQEIREKASAMCDGWASHGSTHTNSQDGCSYYCDNGNWQRQSCPGGGGTGGGGSQGDGGGSTPQCNSCGGIGQGTCTGTLATNCTGGSECYGNLVNTNGTCTEPGGNTVPVGTPPGLGGDTATPAPGTGAVGSGQCARCDLNCHWAAPNCGVYQQGIDCGAPAGTCQQVDCLDANNDYVTVFAIDNNCVPGTTGTPPPSYTPPPVTGDPLAQCLEIKVWDTNWNQLTTAQIAQLDPGNVVRLTVKGNTTQGTFDRARFGIDGAADVETTLTKPVTGEFYLEYTIPVGTNSFSVTGQVHHVSLNQWF